VTKAMVMPSCAVPVRLPSRKAVTVRRASKAPVAPI
jgi:hypothetical protein